MFFKGFFFTKRDCKNLGRGKLGQIGYHKTLIVYIKFRLKECKYKKTILVRRKGVNWWQFIGV